MNDALAIVAGVAFLVAVLAVVFVPILLIQKRNRRLGKGRRRGDGNVSSSMNNIINMN